MDCIVHGVTKSPIGLSDFTFTFTHLNAEFQRIARRDKEAFLSDQCKEIEGKKGMGKTRDHLRKLEIPREHFMQRRAQ